MLEPGRGILLLAAASLPDPNFDHTVVLLCEHNSDTGSFGLVLNHATTVSIQDVLPDISKWNAPLFRGGPVQLNSLHFIHRGCSADPTAIPLADGLYWGSDFDAVREALDSQEVSPESFRFFAGYSGWGKRQLASEMKENSWYLARAAAETIFVADITNLWRNAFRTLGPDYAVLANFPDDCMFN